MTGKPELTAFISYAHDDRDYVETLLDGLKKHTKHSRKIQWSIWDDKQIPQGAFWHQAIQEQVQKCDFALLLVSSKFLASEYIEKNEFNNFLERQRNSGFRFFPVLLEPCDIEQWPELQRIQFFMPEGRDYGRSDIPALSYADLVKFHDTNGRLLAIPNADRERYHLDLVKALESALEEHLAKRGAAQEFFKLAKLAQELTQRDLLGPGIRSRATQNFYWFRALDHEIREALARRESFVILGNSLAGKTRALYEALKALPDLFVLLPADNPKSLAGFALPKTEASNYVAVFDDIDEYLIRHGKEQLEELMTLLMDRGVPFVATCRTGNEWLTFESTISHKLRENFQIYTIARMEEAEVEGFKKAWRAHAEAAIFALDERAFDHNVGSYFIQLTVMKNRYRDLEKILAAYHVRVPQMLPREILKALKIFFYTENTVGRGLYSSSAIQDFCERSLLRKHEPAPTPAQSSNARNTFDSAEWRTALMVLQGSQYELGFIELIGDMIYIEEAYIQLVIQTDMPLEGIIPTLKALYPDQSLREFGFLDDLRSFTKLVNGAANLREAKQIVEKMGKLGIPPNEKTFNILLNKAASFREAEAVLQQMQQAGIKPDAVTFNSLLNKAASFREAEAVLQQMQQAGIKPDEVTFTSLLNKAASFREAEAVLQQMQQAGIKPNEVTFTSLLNKAASFGDAEAVLTQMQRAGIKPNEVTFNSLLNKAESFREAEAVLQQMEQAGLKPNAVTFNSLLNKAESFRGAEAVLLQMQQAGLKPSAVTFNSLLNKAESFRDAEAVLQQMQQTGLKPDVFSFTILLNKAKSFRDAEAVLQQMQQAGLKPNEITFTSLLNKAESFRDAQAVLEQMLHAGLKPNEITFTSLLNKAASFREAEAVLQQMQQAGLKLDEVTFTSLLNKAASFRDAQAVLQQMQQAGLKLDEVTFTSLLNKAESFRDAQAVLQQMLQAGLKPNEITFTSLLNKAESLRDAEAVFQQMQQTELKPDVFSFTILLNKVNSLSDAEAVLQQMQQAGLKPNEITFTSLLNKAESFRDAETVLQQMQQAGLKPDIVTFNSLLKKTASFNDAHLAFAHKPQAWHKPKQINLSTFLKVFSRNPVVTLSKVFADAHLATFLAGPFWSQIVLSLCNDKRLAERFLLPHLHALKQIPAITRQFAYHLESLGLRKAALELIEAGTDKGFWYLNVKGNCLQEENPREALQWYEQAIAAATTDKESCIALNNAAQLIYKHQLRDQYERGMELCRMALSLVPYSRFRFPGETLLLLSVELTEIDLLADSVGSLMREYQIEPNAARKLTPRIPDPAKQSAFRQVILLLEREKRTVRTRPAMQS